MGRERACWSNELAALQARLADAEEELYQGRVLAVEATLKSSRRLLSLHRLLDALAHLRDTDGPALDPPSDPDKEDDDEGGGAEGGYHHAQPPPTPPAETRGPMGPGPTDPAVAQSVDHLEAGLAKAQAAVDALAYMRRLRLRAARSTKVSARRPL